MRAVRPGSSAAQYKQVMKPVEIARYLDEMTAAIKSGGQLSPDSMPVLMAAVRLHGAFVQSVRQIAREQEITADV